MEKSQLIPWTVFYGLTGLTGTACLLRYFNRITFREAFLLVLSASILAMVLLVFRCLANNRTGIPQINTVFLLVFGMVLAAGIVFRTYRFSVFPPDDGQMVEEYQTASYALNSIETETLDIYFPLVNLVAETGFRLFGMDLRGMRWAFTLYSLTGVLFFFMAATQLFRSVYTVFFVSMLFATQAYLAGSSRIAMETMSPVTTLVVAIAAFALFLRYPDTGTLISAGLADGLLLTEYFSYKLTGGLIMVCLAATCLCMRSTNPEDTRSPKSRPARFTRLSHFFLALVMPFTVVLPTLVWPGRISILPFTEGILRHHNALRFDGFSDLITLQMRKVWITVRFFFISGMDCREILPGSLGIIDPITGILSGIAFIYCLVTLRKNFMKLFLVTGITGIVLLSGLLVLNPQRYRLIPAIPMVLLLIGYPADSLPENTRFRRFLKAVVLTGLMGVIVPVNADRFFNTALSDAGVQRYFYDLNLLLAREIDKIQKEHTGILVYLMTDRKFLESKNAYRFLYDYSSVHVVNSTDEIRDPGGFLVAHDSHIPMPQDLLKLGDCVVWDTRFNLNTICICRPLQRLD
ncbi:hypothetical protein JXA40_09150 [bacterium]|nr:hypothetical protein [candidate division CSSED10-310 bacterium]